MGILILGGLFVIGVINHLNPKDKKGHAQQIQYDLCDQKRLVWIAFGVSGVQVTAILGVVLASKDIVLSTMVKDICFLVALIGSPLVIALWVEFLNCIFYLKRLQRNGYGLPQHKKEYGGKLSNLPLNKDSLKQTEQINKGSVVLAVICWLVSFGLLVGAVVFWMKYQDVEDIVRFCMIVLGIMCVCWIVVGICYWFQRLNSKYRDDVNIQSELKIRVHFLSGIGFIILMLYLSGMSIVLMDRGVKYVINAREEQAVLWRIENEGTEI